jgi:hypothetical protein
MSYCERETEFLRDMLVGDDKSEYRELQAQLAQAHRALTCIRRASRRVVLLMLLCVAGIGYSAVFIPEFVEGRPHYLISIFITVILACLICLATYCALWLWHSHTAAKIRVLCRKALLGREQARHGAEDPACPDIRGIRSAAPLCLDRPVRSLRPAPDAESPFKAP